MSTSLDRHTGQQDKITAFATAASLDAVRTVGKALSQNRLCFAYQPIVAAKSPSTIAFYESLARIKTNDGGLISAGEFVSDLEHHDVGRLLDMAALRNAMTLISEQRNLRVSVNLSAASVGDMAWLQVLEEACARDPICGDFLIVEITESAFLDLSQNALWFLNRIRELGASVAIDDFGAGHTSLSQLGKFRFDFLKIDKSFVQDFVTNPGNRYLVRSMIEMARHFEMVSVIEGIEDPRIGQELADMGADCLQGYAYGKPTLMDAWGSAQKHQN